MKLHNLIINDSNIENKDLIIDGINELDVVISNNYTKILDKEVGIEFNIGSRLGEPREYLVIYSNPQYKNNPYVFVLKQTDEGKKLFKETELDSFISLGDLDVRKEINKTLVVGFNNLPKYAFLSLSQIKQAREYAEDYDIER